jgi:septal ring-binding cell division protein DamX
MKAHPNTSQMELFSQIKTGEAGNTPSSNPFLSFILSYEKTMLVIIGFIITGVICFCVGVEKGKKLAMLESRPAIEQPPAAAPMHVAPRQTTHNAAPQEEKIPAPSQATTQDSDDNYTIQVASYQSKASASKQANVLLKKGLAAHVRSKGSYSILCIGKFNSKEKAKAVLTELKKSYGDCYIRRL